MGISAFLTGVLFADHHVAIPVAFVAGIAFGAFFGLMNGAMVAFARVPSLVITLGTLYVIRGIDFLWAKGRQINAADMPDGFLKLGSDTILGIPVLALITVVVMLIVGDGHALLADGPRAVRDRLQPGRGQRSPASA